MLALIDEYNVEIFKATEEINRLASIYVEKGIIPFRYRTDAMHIAAAVVKELDMIVSLNFRHIVRKKTVEECALVNSREGYRLTGIYSPSELINWGQ